MRLFDECLFGSCVRDLACLGIFKALSFQRLRLVFLNEFVKINQKLLARK